MKLLARRDASRLAIIGSGVQARSHLEAIGLVRELRRSPRVESDSRTIARRSRARCGRARTHPIKVAASAQDAVDGADLVVLATASREPVVESEWIADGAHVCAVGACRPDQREMDTASCRAWPGLRRFAHGRAGRSRRHRPSDAGGRVRRKRTSPENSERSSLGSVRRQNVAAEVTMFKSLGMAVEDVAAAHLAYVKAAERGLGRGFVL